MMEKIIKESSRESNNYSSEPDDKETGCSGSGELHNGKGRPGNFQDSENGKWSYS